MAMGKMDKWSTEHTKWNAWIHIWMGLGIAWLLSLIWQGYSLISLVLGIVFLVAGIAGHVYVYFASRKIEI